MVIRLFILLLISDVCFGTDLEPMVKVKVSNQAESNVVDVRSDLDAYKRFTVDAYISNAIPVSLAPQAANILKQNEITVATKTESDLSGTTYTVPTGKIFRLVTFHGSFDIQSPIFLRFKKQTACTGSWATLFRISLKIHGQDESSFEMVFPNGVNVGVAGDCFKVTYASDLSKGSLWSGYTGVEF
jgi:hypothetical protein